MNSVINVIFLISLGAVPGAISRYYLTVLFGRWFGIAFPYGTLFINVTGAFMMGFFATIIPRLTISSSLSLLITVGFLGAYTTFSTYALDTSNLLRTRDYKAVIIYWIGTPILGFISIELGILLAKIV
ncbi:fluoride efflux transporter CrcB [Nostoc sp. LEGE 06077]|uniref:fluoride efflux transporter CrcB n=1 Tax=Nostoc sp. LEGE 06077 TaxID=915325 RepID=UPI00187EF874|nr:fluoride efflux transporter CrcB [Nostoc sp. LEGE 06077]MBE9205730.1 fluoride efflux transporter CrcB [Nostoc sp. LEGE 06077]